MAIIYTIATTAAAVLVVKVLQDEAKLRQIADELRSWVARPPALEPSPAEISLLHAEADKILKTVDLPPELERPSDGV